MHDCARPDLCAFTGYCRRAKIHRQPECAMSKPFRVTWSVDIQALTPKEAAEAAWQQFRMACFLAKGTEGAPKLTVTGVEDGHTTEIDLSTKVAT